MDFDFLDMDDELGEAEWPLKDVRPNEDMDFWLDVGPVKKPSQSMREGDNKVPPPHLPPHAHPLI